MTQHSFCVVVSVTNVQETIHTLVDTWHSVAEKAGDGSFLVIHCGGSTDRTAEILRGLEIQTSYKGLEAS